MGFDPEAMKAALRSPEGQKLLRQLKSDGGTAFSQASAAFRAGDTAAAISLLQPMLHTKESEQLLKEIRNKLG